MAVELAKNIFFFIGSVLGILAFFKPFFEPMLDKNKQRWKKIQEIVTEDDFADLEFQVGNSRYIRDETLHKIQRLMYDIEQSSEYLRFGPLLKKYYRNELKELLRLYICFRELVQVPEWEPEGHLEDSNQEPGWCFNKKAFDKGKGYAEDYADDLYVASWYATRMRNTYRRLSILADIHLIEIPFSWYIASSRMAEIEIST